MNLIQKNNFFSFNNILFKANNLNYETKKKLKINEFCYPFILQYENKNYLYYRQPTTNPSPGHEMINRCLINYNPEEKDSEKINIIDDKNYILDLGIASHNFRLFNINNQLIGLGGQSLNKEILLTSKTTNTRYLEYNKKTLENNIYLNGKQNNVLFHGYQDLLNNTFPCPYFANGLHLFKFNDINNIYNNENINQIKIENNELPIINGIHPGRKDGHYGINNNNFNMENNGLTVYDSNANLLYNKKTQKYYLYHRANIGTGIRYIQYTTSNDLINWSPFNLLNLTPEINKLKSNIYFGNFFKIDDINDYILILPLNKRINNSYNGTDKLIYLELYLSNDCENWNYIGNIGTHIYYKDWMVCGEPLKINNKYYFFNLDTDYFINSYYIEKNRFSFVTSNNSSEISNIRFKLMIFKDGYIKLNYITLENGYINCQLLDKNENIIEKYSFNDFNIINSNNNEIDKIITWNNNSDIPNNIELYLDIKAFNFNIFAINGEFVN